VTYGNGRFVTVGSHSNGGDGIVVESPDGSIWTETEDAIVYPLNDIAYGNNIFVTVGALAINLNSPDGSTWTCPPNCTSQVPFLSLNGVAYGNGEFVAVGDSGSFRNSSSGSIWKVLSMGSKQNLNSVTYGNGRFVAIGDSGAILTSPDDSIWTTSSSGTTNALYGLTYGNNQFVIVGGKGTILTSQDCSKWAAVTSGTTSDLYDVVYGNGQFVAVGKGGTILFSKQDNSGIELHPYFTTSISPQVKLFVGSKWIPALLQDAPSGKQLKVKLYNIAGRLIQSTTSTLKKDVISISTQGIPAGMYYLSIIDGSKSIVSTTVALTR
jgi:hypothetical protein